jgi:putative DNA primase/helicase
VLTSIVPVRDPNLPERLKSEYGGILQWMLDGCRKWQQSGLGPLPKVVADATESYLSGEDSLGRWMDERTEVNLLPKIALFSDLFADYRAWTESTKEHCFTQKRFTQELESRGVTTARGMTGRGFSGIKLKPQAGDQ